MEVVVSEEITALSGVGVRDLLDAGLHFGHQTKRWNPKMKRYIFGQRNGIYIIDLSKSLELLTEALTFLHATASRGRKTLFVGTKKQAQDTIREVAEKCAQPYVVNRWLGGALTNNQTVRISVGRMRELEQMEEDGRMEALSSKKEVAQLRRELAKLHRNLSGIADMDELPGALFVVDCNREAIAIAEANRLKIPVVAIVDTNCDPNMIDYPVPGNDDAIRAIRLILTLVGDTIGQAAGEYDKRMEEEARKRAEEEEARRKAEQEAKERARQADAERKARQAEEERRRAEAERQRAEAERQQAAEAAQAAPPAETASPEGDAAPAAAPEEPSSSSIAVDPFPGRYRLPPPSHADSKIGA
jgi:small subunit ribosomal protein S2